MKPFTCSIQWEKRWLERSRVVGYTCARVRHHRRSSMAGSGGICGVNWHQSNGEPIRVMIVDDHEMVRMGLATFVRLSSDLELVGEAANGEDAVRVCEE